ncbi:response regulator [Thermoanaerobacterium thermosaccharolyticum]|uniref:Stage 0 sporulation protein A homolog n=2 Tax=Thermoanaerobacterium thermosaccharolyticum TaxID=1517 RepID=D9TNV5_THETC|nr:response regulator [Thermoanaerobacterium thermosaccharolyticum]ADL70135.1 two component transcriptional regulator, winged helix family [Thermoanaerobacterium thermosaccharolyticum DSM 571]AST57354.1 YycH protein [Thermoanaerobacterium thermosaccharolyticum]PHO07315.1 DNA-binding response regulator [Thermoanaerobacterium thermosaccharolyticum]TCW33451.1 two-component system response regulator VicR [Thermohydrogenium kirishiense]
MSSRILIIDDEKPIVEILKYNLEKNGYSTIEAYDGEEGLKLAQEKNPDLILLDVMLPKMDGFTVLRILRQTMTTPILMLTAKEEEVDKVLGLELGADDYVTKPFSMRELIARVKANLRRSGINNGEGMSNVIIVNNLSIDLSKYKVEKNGRPIELTSREFDLLKFLVANRGLIFSREMLLEKVWGYEYFGDVRTVDVTIRRLREKIEDDPANPRYIHTKRGVGYYFSEESEL